MSNKKVSPLTPEILARGVFDTPQAAAYLQISVQSLEIWRCKGGGPRFAKLGRLIRYRRADLDAWLAEHMRENTVERQS